MLRVVERPSFGLTPLQMRVRLFGRAFLMSLLQAGGVTLIAHGSYWAGCTGFLISYHWTGATISTVDYRVPWGRWCYGAGGGLGTLIIVAIAYWR